MPAGNKKRHAWCAPPCLLSCICLSGYAKRDTVVEDEGCKHVKELSDIKKTDKRAFWDFKFSFRLIRNQLLKYFSHFKDFSAIQVFLTERLLCWVKGLFLLSPACLDCWPRSITQQQQGEGGDSEDAKQCQITRLHRESSFSENCLSEAWQRNIFSANCFRSTKVSALRSFLRIQPECLRSLMS